MGRRPTTKPYGQSEILDGSIDKSVGGYTMRCTATMIYRKSGNFRS